MVGRCSAVDCQNSKDDPPGTTFHKFPLKNEELLAKWVQAVKRDQWKPTKWSLLCSAHFTEDDFYPCQSRRQLRENSVPTIFSHLRAIKKQPSLEIRKLSEVSFLSKDVMIIEVDSEMLSSIS